MAEYTGNFETGTVGNVVSVLDTGSLTQWSDRAGGGANGTLNYSSTQKYGTLSCDMTFSATPSASYVAWDSSVLGGSLTELWGRVYLYHSGLPNTSSGTMRAYDVSTRAWEIRINSSGYVELIDTDSIVGTGAVAISTGQWIRIEFHVINSVGSGFVEAKLFNNADSTTESETITSTGTNSTLTKTDLMRIGDVAGSNASRTVYMDNILVNNTGYPGPVASAVQTLAPTVDSVDGSWTDQSGGSSLFAAIDETSFSDADYIQSELSPSASGCRVKLASGSDPASSSGHEINWRAGKSATGGQTINMTVKLYQGGGNSLGGGTLIADFDRNAVDALTTYTETLSGGEADAITDYADLYLEFWATV